MRWLVKGFVYWALAALLYVPLIFILILIAFDVARYCGRRRVAV